MEEFFAIIDLGSNSARFVIYWKHPFKMKFTWG